MKWGVRHWNTWLVRDRRQNVGEISNRTIATFSPSYCRPLYVRLNTPGVNGMRIQSFGDVSTTRLTRMYNGALRVLNRRSAGWKGQQSQRWRVALTITSALETVCYSDVIFHTKVMTNWRLWRALCSSIQISPSGQTAEHSYKLDFYTVSQKKLDPYYVLK